MARSLGDVLMAWRAKVLRQDSEYPQGRPHDVELRWWGAKMIPLGCVDAVLVGIGQAPVAAESAFRAREIFAQRLGADPQGIRVEEVEETPELYARREQAAQEAS